jgi:hypothetical protein
MPHKKVWNHLCKGNHTLCTEYQTLPSVYSRNTRHSLLFYRVLRLCRGSEKITLGTLFFLPSVSCLPSVLLTEHSAYLGHTVNPSWGKNLYRVLSDLPSVWIKTLGIKYVYRVFTLSTECKLIHSVDMWVYRVSDKKHSV